MLWVAKAVLNISDSTHGSREESGRPPQGRDEQGGDHSPYANERGVGWFLHKGNGSNRYDGVSASGRKFPGCRR
jgi:hypothetical protein